MADDAVLVEARGAKLFVTLNRPQALNAQDDAVRRGLVEALDRFEADDGLRVALLVGNGRAFSAGADLKERRDQPGLLPSDLHFTRVDQLRKPIIACIHGYALGGGLEIALCCDIRLATRDARLGTPEARTIGGMPGIAVHRLGRVIPLGEALKLMLSSQPISGQRAFDIGLVQDVFDDREAMLAAADVLSDQIIECNPSSLVTIKQIARTPVELEVAMTQRLLSLGRIDQHVRPDGDRSEFLSRRKAQTA